MQALAGLGVGLLMLWVITAVITVLSGRDSKVDIAAGPSLYFALAMVATACMFLAVGALTSQLAATRRQAASFAAAFLGVAYALRMIADAGVGLHFMIWLTPLGWVEELQPLTAPQPLALVPIIAFTASWPPSPCGWRGAATWARASWRTGRAPSRISDCSSGRRASPSG